MHDTLGVVLVILVVFCFIAAVVGMLMRPPINDQKDNKSPTRHPHKAPRHERKGLRD